MLTGSLGWRSVFWVNLPIGVIAIFLAARFVPESKAARARRIDPVGQGLVLVALGALTSAVIEGPRAGWGSGVIVGLFTTAGLATVALLLYEPRRTDPLLDLRFFRSVPFSSATVIAVCAFAAFAGFLFLNTLYLQQARGLSAFHTGLCTLPLAAMMAVCAPISGRLVGKYGARPSLLLAGGGICLGTLLLRSKVHFAQATGSTVPDVQPRTGIPFSTGNKPRSLDPGEAALEVHCLSKSPGRPLP